MTCTPIAPNPAGGFRQLWGLRRDPAVDASTAEKAGAAGPWLTGRIDRKDLRLRIVHVNDTHHFHLGGACDVDPSTQSTPLESVKALIAAGRHAGIDTLYLSAGGAAREKLITALPAMSTPAHALMSFSDIPRSSSPAASPMSYSRRWGSMPRRWAITIWIGVRPSSSRPPG